MAVAINLIKLRRKQTNKNFCFFDKSYVPILHKKIAVFCRKNLNKWSKYGMPHTVELVIKFPIVKRLNLKTLNFDLMQFYLF